MLDKGGFAASGMPDDPEKYAFLDRERKILQRGSEALSALSEKGFEAHIENCLCLNVKYSTAQ